MLAIRGFWKGFRWMDCLWARRAAETGVHVRLWSNDVHDVPTTEVIVLCGTWAQSWMIGEAKRVAVFTGEAYLPNLAKYDLLLSSLVGPPATPRIPFSYMEIEAMYSLPFPSTTMYSWLQELHDLYAQTPKTDFAAFAVRNPRPRLRRQMFSLMQEYKRVHSYGTCERNVFDECLPARSTQPYFAHLARFRFILCFENQSVPGYRTEKLWNALATGGIPIYWGDPTIDSVFNADRMIWIREDTTEALHAAMTEIQRLDQDPDAYALKCALPIFAPQVTAAQLDADFHDRLDRCLKTLLGS